MRLRSVVVVILPAILLGGLLTVLFARPQQRKAPQPSPPPLPPRPTCWGWAREGAVQAEFCSAFEGGWKTTPIPNRLWQRKPDPQASSTHHTSHDFSHTWKDLNPGIRVKQHGDKEADAFISKWFTDQVRHRHTQPKMQARAQQGRALHYSQYIATMQTATEHPAYKCKRPTQDTRCVREHRLPNYSTQCVCVCVPWRSPPCVPGPCHTTKHAVRVCVCVFVCLCVCRSRTCITFSPCV